MRAIPEGLREALEEFRAEVRAKFGERMRDIRLFGSYARGEQNADSDVDILVLIDGLTQMEQFYAGSTGLEISFRTGLDLSPLFMSTEHFDELRNRERRLALDIDEEGIPL